MKKKIFIVSINTFMLSILCCFDLPYVVITDTDLYNTSTAMQGSIKVLTKGEMVSEYKTNSIILSWDSNTEFGNYKMQVLTEQNEKGWVKVTALGIQNQENLSQNIISRIWVPEYYNKVLQSKSRLTLLPYEPFYRDFEKYRHMMDDPEEPWYEYFIPTRILLSSVFIGIYPLPLLSRVEGYVTNISDNNISWTCTDILDKIYETPIKTDKIPIPFIKDLSINNSYVFTLYLDGDYLDIYLNGNLFLSCIAVDDFFLAELDNLLETNTCDLSNITWPRRADKTHSVGATCIVAESLRLRKEENTSSATLQTMQPGTQVQIRQLGKKETIDGITANWVQVEVVDASLKESPEEGLSHSVSTSEQGADVRGATGWCFGGYIVEK